jgi:hypothetical protein
MSSEGTHTPNDGPPSLPSLTAEELVARLFRATPGQGGNSAAEPPSGSEPPIDPKDLVARFFRAPPTSRVVTGRIAFFCRLIGHDRLLVCFVGEDGAGMMAQVIGKVTEFEPRANIIWHMAEARHDVGGGLMLFSLNDGNPFSNRKTLLRLRKRLRKEFSTNPVPRTQIWTEDFCAAAYRTKDRPKLLAALTNAISALNINMTDVKSKTWIVFDGPDSLSLGTPYCLLAFEMQLPERGPEFREKIRKAIEALDLGGELFFDEEAVAAYREAREKAGGSVFS